jgi:hypothetical protein
MEVEYWDPSTGKMYRVSETRNTGDGISLPLSLDPYGSLFVVFAPEMDKRGFDVYEIPDFGAFMDHQLEQALLLEGPWKVNFPEELAGAGEVVFDSLVFWNHRLEDGIRFFSGIATYENEFTWEGSVNDVYLEFEDIVEAARVYLNGDDLGILWTKPFRADLTGALRQGKNTLIVEVANTWANGLAGDARLPRDQRRTFTNITRLPNAWTFPLAEIPNEQYDLIDGGLRGEVRLMKIK